MAAWLYTLVLMLVSLRLGAGTLPQKTKIVFTPLPIVSSQYFNMLNLAEEMHKRGHTVTILSTSMLRRRQSPVKHVEYELSSGKDVLSIVKRLSGGENQAGLLSYIMSVKNFLKIVLDTCYSILLNEETKQLILEADLIVTFSMNKCGTYIAHIFNKPFIVLHPASFSLIGSYADVPLPPSYVPIIGLQTSDEMSFLKRTQNFLMYLVKNVAVDVGVTYNFKALQNEYGAKQEWFSTLFSKAEVYIVTVDFTYEFVHPIMPNVFMVGPFTPKPAARLPEDLENFMQSSGDAGVVVISFGSAISSLSHHIIGRILMAISNLKQKFIWKVELNADAIVPPNLKVVDWLPQNDLLGHAKTKAFISHMGINGASEAAYHGVPIVAACIMGDSFQNSIKFGKKTKMSKFIDIYEADADTWKKTIEEVINNSSYKESAIKTSKLMRSWPRTNVEKAGDVIQYVIDNGGRIPHLKSYAKNLNWFQYHCIDVIAFLFTIVVAFCYISYKATQLLYLNAMKLSRKIKVQ